MRKTHGRNVFCALVVLIGFGLGTSVALAQHTACMPGEFLKNSCPPGPLMGAPGTQVVVPIATICPKTTMMWMTVTCPPPGCLTWSHSHRRGRICRITPAPSPIIGPGGGGESNEDLGLEAVDDAVEDDDEVCEPDAVPVFSESFRGEKQVGARFQNDGDVPASYLFRTKALAKIKPGETHDLKVFEVSAALQMIENPSDVDTGVKGELIFKEALALGAGGSDQDRFFNLEGDALLVLENTGKEAVELQLSVVRRALSEENLSGVLATGHSQIGLAPGWNQGSPTMYSFVYRPDSQMLTSSGELLSEPKVISIVLEPGQSFSGELADKLSGDLRIEYVNLSGFEAHIEKEIVVSYDRVLEAGQTRMLLCVGAGDMIEHVTSDTAGLLNTMAAVRLVHDQPPGTLYQVETKGFPDVDLETAALSGVISLKYKCWRIMFSTGYTLHYKSGSTVQLDGGIQIPIGAMSGQTFQQWFTVNAMSGVWNQTLSCHPVVVVP